MFRKVAFSLFSLFLLFSCGSDSGSGEEPVEVNLPSVTTIAASSITNNSARVGGNITNDGGATITARGIAWGTNSNPTISGNKTTDGTGDGEFGAVLSDLESATQYYFRAYATNSEGTAYGDEKTFTTNVSLAAVSTKDVTDITDSSAVSGGLISDDGGTTIISKGICWNTNGNPTIEDDITENGQGADEFVSELSGLLPNTTYSIRAYVVNSEGVSYGNEIQFTTNPSLPSVTTKEITEIGQISAISGGVISSDGGADITARGVCWSTDPNPTIEDNNTAFGSGIGDFEITLQELTPNTQYYVRAYATNDAGTGYGQEISFTTLEVSTIYDGDIVLLTQQEVDDFGSNNFLEITGSLTIGDNTGIVSDITNLDALSSLETVGNFLAIYNNDQLENLNGLVGITSVGGDLLIGMNDLFTEINGLGNITVIGGALEIFSNDLIQNIQGLSNVTSLGGGVRIVRNEALASLAGFPSLTEIDGNITIRENAITSLIGLESLRNIVGDFSILNEVLLQDMTAIQNLESVQGYFGITGTAITEINGFNDLSLVSGLIRISGNNQLTSVQGFSSITTCSGIQIQNNDLLVSISGFDGLETVMGDFSININGSLSSIGLLNSLTAIEGDLSYSSNSTSDMGFLANLTLVGGNARIADTSTLRSLSGMENLAQINGDLTIDNIQATSLSDGLAGLITVGGNINIKENTSLLSVGFSNLTSVLGDIQISNNVSLTDYCELQAFLINDGLGGTFSAVGNAYNPTAQNIIDGNCSN